MSPDFSSIENARSKMIEQQIRPWNVLDPNVLELLAELRRENFVPHLHRHLAFVDMEVPLPEHQVIAGPKGRSASVARTKSHADRPSA